MVFIKEYFPAGTEFCVRVSYRDKSLYDTILEVFKVLASFGGLGSKSRNGFGSFFVEKVKKDNTNVDFKYNTEEIFRGKSQLQNTLPLFPAFSNQCRLFKTREKYDKWEDALGVIGKVYREARLSLDRPHFYNNRQYVAAPIIVGRRQHGFRWLSRKAKPVFLHVSCQRDKYKRDRYKYIGYILYMPYHFCKGAEKVPRNSIENFNERFLEVMDDFIEEISGTLQEVS